MKTPEHWQRYMSLGVPSAEAPRGHGCIPLELIDVVGFWAPPPEYIPVEISPYETSGYARIEAKPTERPGSAAFAAFPRVGDGWGKVIGVETGIPDPGNEDVETDPNGLDPHQPGAKLDAGKVRMGLVMRGFARALFEVGRVGTYGAGKYSPNGWMEVENGEERYMDAGLRHLVDDAVEEIDKDTDLRHLAQAAWNLLAVLELRLRELEQ